jgi:glycosyltransferase involved in cell wall biosynthesis
MGAPEFDEDVGPGRQVDKRWDGIFIGRHTAEKGIFDLIEIWRRVRYERPGASLVLVGACAPETEAKIRKAIDNIGAGGDIKLAGVVPDREKFELLRASRVLLAPSRVEGWGLVPLEGLGVAVPVVCWDLAAYRESLPETNAIVRVPPGDVEAFASEVLRILDHAQSLTSRDVSIGPRPRHDWHDVVEREWAAVAPQ